jgi:hypothetical protein
MKPSSAAVGRDHALQVPFAWAAAWTRVVGALAVLAALLAVVARASGLGVDPAAAFALQRFSTILVGIVIEAVPFLLLGVVVASIVQGFVGSERLVRLFRRPRAAAMAVASAVGFAFPICDCGLIPIARGLLRAGAPTFAALTFLLAAPVMNPIVLWSTWTAFGDRPGVVALRFAVALGVAWSAGLVGGAILRRQGLSAEPARAQGNTEGGGQGEGSAHSHVAFSVPARLQMALAGSAGEFVEMATFLTIGAMAAAALQVLVPQPTLLALASGPVLSVAVLMALRAIVSVCAAVDAFLALAFAATFSPGALVAFMAFGPVFDLKNAFLLGGTFGRRLLQLYLLGVTPLIFLAGVTINLAFPGL